MYRPVFVLLCILPTLACVESTGEAVEDSQGEIRVSNVERFQLRRTTGFVRPAPPGGCRPSEKWNVDLVHRRLEGQWCASALPRTMNREMSTSELGRIRSALEKMQRGKRPDACPTDVPVTYLDVDRAMGDGSKRTEHYVEQRSACGDAVPVTSASIEALRDLVTALAASEVASGE